MRKNPDIVLSDAVPTGYNDPLTEEEVREIVSLKVDDDCTVEEIVEKTGRSRATILRYLSRNGISFRTPRAKTPPMDRRQYQTVRVSREHGMLSAQIAPLMQQPLAEVNRAYAAPSYDYYVSHR